MKKLFEKFSLSLFSLEIRSGKKLLFRSKERGIKGLVRFIQKNNKHFPKNLIVFDKKIGSGAALLCAYFKAKEVFAVTGSKLAEKTLKKFRIKFYFSNIVPKILNKNNDGLCPIEKLSLRKTPGRFYELVKNN